MLKLFRKTLALAFCAIALSMLVVNPNVEAASALPDYIQIIYNIDNQLGSNEVNSIINTSDGYIWLATYSGLLRYNGTRFETYADSDTPGFETSSIRVLAEDGRGQLWIGTNDRGLFCLRNGELIHIDSKELFSESIRAIDIRSDGDVIIGSSMGIALVEPVDFSVATLSGLSESKENVIALECTPQGSVWYINSIGDIQGIHNDTIIKINSAIIAEKLASEFEDGIGAVRSLYQDENGVIYIGTEKNNIIVLSDPSASANLNIKVLRTGELSNINSIEKDSSGKLWLCSDTGIGQLTSDGTVISLKTELTNSVEGMCEDYEGNLWFSSSRLGVLHLVKSKFTDISLAAEITPSVVNSTCIYDGKLYVAADDGLYILDPENGYAPIENEITELLSGIRIRCLTVNEDSPLYISCYEKYGLISYRGDGDWTMFDGDNGLSGEKLRLAVILSDGSIAVGLNSGLDIVRNGNVAETYGEDDGLTNTMILSVTEHPDGTLYLGTDGGGLFTLKDGVISPFELPDELAAGVILRTAYDKRNNCIWCSSGEAVFCINDKGEVVVADSIPIDGSVYDFCFAPDGNIWLLTASRLIVTSYDALLGVIDAPPMIIQKADGLPSTITANSWNCTDGSKLYLSCGSGTALIDMCDIYLNSVPPIVKIDEAYVDGSKLLPDENGELIVDGNARRITIRFSLLSYTGQSGSLTYELIGSNEGAVTISSDDAIEISYTNLHAGDYTFKLSGINGDGFQCATAEELSFTKTPRWFELPILWVMLIIALAAIVYLLTQLNVYYETRRVAERQNELKAITVQSMLAIANTIDAKDKYTIGHSRRVAGYSVAIARQLHMPEADIDNLYYSALLHDIGKIGIPDTILSKPSKLTDDEYDLIKKHTTIGGDILQEITLISHISDGARYHHEHFDGHGYSTGLKGREIPLFARIIGVADAYDAMNAERPYRKKLSREHILNELRTHSGSQFDPDIVKILLKCIELGNIEDSFD